MIKGQIIGGEFNKIILRQKSDENIELGELLIGENNSEKFILQVFCILYGSQISQQNLELISGLKLEEGNNETMFDNKLRNYKICLLKNLINIRNGKARVCKTLPEFFSLVKSLQKEDINFLTKPRKPLYIGKLRSGSSTIDVDIFLPGEDVLRHHILIPAATGRGKSNLTSVILWNSLEQDYCGFLVLDPHDEYYGRNKIGLKDHPKSDKVVYYTTNTPPPGTRNLIINLKLIKPSHFNGVIDWSDPQKEALSAYYRIYNETWIEHALIDDIENFQEGTLSVIKRRLMSLLDLDVVDKNIYCKGIYDKNAGETTIKDICSDLEKGKTVIVDTSTVSGSQEILIGSLIVTEIFHRYKKAKINGMLDDKPVISIIIEEAPRVLGKEVLEKGPNIFSTIAREGRKFKVGLCAITQLPSLIPRQILANMCTKIILGIEMGPERQAIIESSAQDLSTDSQNIASLDIGEAIVTSNFTKFATPIKIPLFDEIVKESKQKNKVLKNSFSGISL